MTFSLEFSDGDGSAPRREDHADAASAVASARAHRRNGRTVRLYETTATTQRLVMTFGRSDQAQ